MQRVMAIVTISACLSGGLVACGDDEPGTPPAPAAEAPAPAEPAAVPAEPEPEPEPEAQAGMRPTGEDQSELDCEAETVECPMFDWMEANTKRAVEDGDVAAMARAFHAIEFMAPTPAWDDVDAHGDQAWVKLARRGAELSEAGDARQARRLCKGCHDQWRDAFREQGYRTAPMAELPANAEQGRQDL